MSPPDARHTRLVTWRISRHVHPVRHHFVTYHLRLRDGTGAGAAGRGARKDHHDLRTLTLAARAREQISNRSTELGFAERLQVAGVKLCLGSGSLGLATVTHADQRRLRPTTMQRSTELGFAERLQSPK